MIVITYYIKQSNIKQQEYTKMIGIHLQRTKPRSPLYNDALACNTTLLQIKYIIIFNQPSNIKFIYSEIKPLSQVIINSYIA